MPGRTILIIDDEPKMCKVLRFALEPDGFAVTTAENAEAGLELFSKTSFDLVITDLKMPGKDGLHVLGTVKKLRPETEVIMMTAYATAQNAVEAMKKGAYDYIIKPFEMDELKLKVRHIMEKRKLLEENVHLKKELKNRYALKNMVGKSGVMQEVYKLVEKVAHADATVLIRGESGTGKELVAQAIHHLSPRAGEPFIAVNCAALPDNLLESELFGHEKGAFTGADKMKPGRFELAAAGTIFLDEIGDISPSTQIKLLRVLQNRTIERLGGIKTMDVKARTICATNRHLEQALKDRSFREDLYYRINVFPITLPPLRDHKEDIPDLAEHFLKKFSGENGAIDGKALNLLMKYHWPGNVRELENTIERALILSGKGEIREQDIPPHIRSATPPASTGAVELPKDGISLEDVEKNLIREAINRAGGNKSKAAKLLGITRRKLYSMMERLGLSL
jgi:DNA-binding NtrC family response regulator